MGKLGGNSGLGTQLRLLCKGYQRNVMRLGRTTYLGAAGADAFLGAPDYIHDSSSFRRPASS
jgi:hypothetical protein